MLSYVLCSNVNVKKCKCYAMYMYMYVYACLYDYPKTT